MASCWRELGGRDGIEVKVITYAKSKATNFSNELMAGVDWEPRDRDGDYESLRKSLDEFQPQVLVVPGWLDRNYREAAKELSKQGVCCVLTMDTPWWGTTRQHVGLIALKSYVKLFRYVAVTGERSFQYALRLGFKPSQVHRPLYGVDYQALRLLLDQRLAQPWPRQFLYVGRYADEKAIDDLVAGYRRYREQSHDPWPLVCCGKGPMESLLNGEAGIENRGFTQPSEVHQEMVRSASLLLPSRFDPWPLIVVEASAAGLPVVYSMACGSPVELVRDRFSGFQLGDQDPESFAETLLEVEAKHAELSEMGKRASLFAEAYSNQFWADRWEALIRREC